MVGTPDFAYFIHFTFIHYANGYSYVRILDGRNNCFMHFSVQYL